MFGGRRVVSLLSLLFVLLFNSDVNAQYGVPSPSKGIFIDKFVGNPSVVKGGVVSFQDNLSASDPRFAPSQQVFFKLVVKNTSDVTLHDVRVQDFVPDFLEPIDDTDFNAGDFASQEQREYILKMRVLSQDKLPSDKGVMCVTNKAEASAEGVSDTDTSQLCIEKQVIAVKEVPAAGPEAGLALLAINAFAAGAGIWLKKKVHIDNL